MKSAPVNEMRHYRYVHVRILQAVKVHKNDLLKSQSIQTVEISIKPFKIAILMHIISTPGILKIWKLYEEES